MPSGPMSEDPQFETLYVPPRYSNETDGPVRYAPVTLAGGLD